MDEDLLFLEESSYLNVCDIRPHDQQEDGNQETIAFVWWINVVCLPSIAVIGLTCNLLNLLVLTSNKSAHRMPSWHLLVALALFDSLFLIFATLDVTPTNLHIFLNSPSLNSLYTRLVLYIRTIASTFFRASILIVVSFNIERFICVCRPLSAHRFCTAKTSKMAIFISLLIAFLLSLQWPLVYRVVECWDQKKKYAYSIITMRDEPALQAYFQFTNCVSLVLFNLLPIALLFILNIQLVRTLRRVVDQDRRRSSGGADTQQMLPHVQLNDPNASNKLNANTLLFAVVLLLLLCIGPQAPARLLYDYLGPYHPTVVIYMCISQLLVFLNASLNFCLYCLVSKRYRSLLRESIRRLVSTQNGCFLSGSHLKTKFSALLHSPTVTEEPMSVMSRRRRASAPAHSICTQL